MLLPGIYLSHLEIMDHIIQRHRSPVLLNVLIAGTPLDEVQGP